MLTVNQFITNENFQFACGEEGNFIQCKTAQLWYRQLGRQHGCETAPGPGGSGTRPLSASSALLCSSMGCRAPCHSAWRCAGLLCCALGCSVLCQSALACAGLFRSALVRPLWCFSSARETRSSSSVERTSVLSESEGSWLLQTEIPALGPWVVCSHANEGSKSL